MKKNIFLAISISFAYIFLISAEQNVYTIDKIVAVIYNPAEPSIILQSDLKPGLDGQEKTLEDVILDRLMLLDAKQLKITISEAEIDRYLSQVQKQHNLNHDDTVKLFKEMGFTYKEGREQLRNMQLIDTLLDYRVKNKVIVDVKDIEKYYNEHPVYQDATYEISQAVVPFGAGSKALKKVTIQAAIESGEILKTGDWQEPLQLKDTDFAADKAYIKDLEPNSIVIVNEDNEGLTLLRLISKKARKLLSLEERSKEIGQILGKERFEKALKEYHNGLLEKARKHIKYIKNIQSTELL